MLRVHSNLSLVSTDNFSLTKYVGCRKICSCKAKPFHCQISVTKVSEVSNIRI